MGEIRSFDAFKLFMSKSQETEINYFRNLLLIQGMKRVNSVLLDDSSRMASIVQLLCVAEWLERSPADAYG